MEAMNFLERRSDTADERVSRVFLTGQGWAVSQQIKEAFHRNDLALVQMLTPEEQVTLASLLLRLHRSLSCQVTGSSQPPTSLP
jgi:DNA-binding MarR family transcriptional regulator